MDRVTDGVSFEWRGESLIIRDGVGKSYVHWLISILLFGVVVAAGWSYLADGAHYVATHGLIESGKTGPMAYVQAIAGLALIVGIIGGVVLAWARPVFGGHEVLALSESAIVLTNIDFGVKWRRRQFRRDEVRDIEYAAVASTDMSDIYAIRFRARGRRVVCFRYIKPDAAAEVIDAVRRFRVQSS